MTDAHCHPTDLDITSDEYDQVKLGGIGAMATVPEDQSKVAALGADRGWNEGDSSTPKHEVSGPKVVSCFGQCSHSTHENALQAVLTEQDIILGLLIGIPCPKWGLLKRTITALSSSLRAKNPMQSTSRSSIR